MYLADHSILCWENIVQYWYIAVLGLALNATTWGLPPQSNIVEYFYIVIASGAFISQRVIVIKELVEHESVLHCIIMWKRLSNPRAALILSKNHSTQAKCLVCDSLFVLMETWKIVTFSFQAFLPNTPALLVQSRPSQCVCVLLRQGEWSDQCMENALPSSSVSQLKVYWRWGNT